MTEIYIITREGRAYTTDGLKYVYNTLQEEYGLKEDIHNVLFRMGAEWNNPNVLAEALEKNPDSYVVVSEEKCIKTAPQTENASIIHNLKAEKDMTSWEIFQD